MSGSEGPGKLLDSSVSGGVTGWEEGELQVERDCSVDCGQFVS